MSNNNAKKKKQLKALYHFQGGICYWCKTGMVPPWQHKHKNGEKINPKLCTLDHLDSRLSHQRGNFPSRYRRVAACWRCNHERGRIEQASLPKDELWRRSGRYPSSSTIGAAKETNIHDS